MKEGNGFFKHFSEDNKLNLEVEYKNWEINGKVKGYNFNNGYLEFEGEYKNGKGMEKG